VEETEEKPSFPELEGLELIEVTVAEGDADIREEADGMSLILDSLAKDTEIQVYYLEGEDWAIIIIDDQLGYIYKDSLIGLPEPEPVIDPENGEEVPTEMKVLIFSSRRKVTRIGSTITLSSVIEGFDGYEIRYQWECDQGDGLQNVPGANEETYSFIATEESLTWDWRLTVYYR